MSDTPVVEPTKGYTKQETFPVLRYFAYDHLPEKLQAISRPFHDMAQTFVTTLPPSAELAAGLRKLLEAKDCIVRAALTPKSG